MVQKPIAEPISPIRRMAGHFIAVLSTSFLMAVLLVINLIQTLSLVVRPFSKTLFRKVNRECANFFWGLCYFWTERVYRIKPIYMGDALTIPPEENAIVICN